MTKRPTHPTKIVSGGQTGVDQAALAVATTLTIPHGGWCPQGRRCEAGTIPSEYTVREMDNPSYAARTRQNVIDSDATLILYRHQLSGGTLLTYQIAQQLERPVFLFDLENPVELAKPLAWLKQFTVATLNVAGPRESSCPGIHKQASALLVTLLTLDGP
jgi:hypothetical protein